MRASTRGTQGPSPPGPTDAGLSDAKLRLDCVERCVLFNGLSTEQRLEVAVAAIPQHFAPKASLVHEGEPARALYLVLSGRAKETLAQPEGPEVVVRLLGPTDLCGWPSVLTDEVTPGTVAALEETSVLSWPRPAVERFYERFPVVSRNALRILTRRLLEQHQRYRELALERVPQRLARTLLRLVRPGGRRSPDPALVDVPLSRAELAQMTGTTLFTVSRVISEWEALGLLQARRGHVIVTDLAALAAIVKQQPADHSPPGRPA